MNDIKILVWLFPILFTFHDFEEIIFMQLWISKNRSYLYERFPGLSRRLLPHFDSISTSSFALGVWEEFILVSIVTVISYITDSYNMWIGLFISFTLHLIVHCLQALIIRKYVPAVATSIICLPACIYIIGYTAQLLPLGTVVLYSILGFIIMAANLGLVHKGMDIFAELSNRQHN